MRVGLEFSMPTNVGDKKGKKKGWGGGRERHGACSIYFVFFCKCLKKKNDVQELVSWVMSATVRDEDCCQRCFMLLA